MKKYDFRLNVDLLKSFVGEVFNKHIHEKFKYTNTVTSVVGFMVNEASFRFVNDFENVDFLGWDDEASVYKIEECKWDSIFASDIHTTTTNLEQVIKNIILINDHFSLFIDENWEYDWWETRAIIFCFKEFEISFEKQDCWFSQEIEINRGYNLIDKISDGQFILKDADLKSNQRIATERQIISL